MMLTLLINFITGGTFCNSISHLAAGLRGESFPSPISKPPGIGSSGPVVNVIWGIINVLIAMFLLEYAPVTIGLTPSFTAFTLGAVLGGSFLGWHFGRLRQSGKLKS